MENATNTPKDTKIIYLYVNELLALLTQDTDLTPEEYQQAQAKYKELTQIYQELTGRGGASHDITTIISQVLGDGDFQVLRKSIQSDEEYKQAYKDQLNKHIGTVELIDSNKKIGKILPHLDEIHADFLQVLETKELLGDTQNKQGDVYILGIAYNLYNNAIKYHIPGEKIVVSVSNIGEVIIITAYNSSEHPFNEDTKNKILSGVGNIEAEKGGNNEQGQGIYLRELNQSLKNLKGGLTIQSNPSILGGYNTNIIIVLPKQDT